MNKDNAVSIITKVVLNLRYQFFIIFLLFLKYIFTLFFVDNGDILISYIKRIIPSFVKSIIDVNLVELEAILLFNMFLLFMFAILMLLLACLYEQNKIEKNLFNFKITIYLFTNIAVTLSNIIVFICLMNFINGINLLHLFESFIESHIILSIFVLLFILLTYITSFLGFFFSKEDY